MENINFSHFGLKEKGGNVSIENTNQAKIEGYDFGDRLLEGIKFIVTIEDDTSLSVKVDPRAEGYFGQLNEELWLDKALKHALRHDVFESMEGSEDIGLIMGNGQYNTECEMEDDPKL
jgi:hypothetical protein